MAEKAYIESSQVQSSDYLDRVHRLGRLTSLMCIIFMIGGPMAICYRFDIFPPMSAFLKGFLSFLPIMAPLAVIEAITYAPILGPGATYLSFITGNITNMKIPAVTSALDAAGVKRGTDEGEVISIIATGVSSLVVIAMLVVLIMFVDVIEPIVTWAPIQPAFDNVMPALFGAMCTGIIFQQIKLSIPTLTFGIVLALVGLPTSFSMPVVAVFALGLGRTMYKKGLVTKID